MATNSPITIGELTDVPAPGSGVKSAWCQEVTNRVVQRFATVAERDAKWPAATAGRGAMCVTLDTATVWEAIAVAAATVWAPLPQKRQEFTVAASGVVLSGTNAVCATLNIPAVAWPRTIEVAGHVLVNYPLSPGTADQWQLSLVKTDGGNVILRAVPGASITVPAYTAALAANVAGVTTLSVSRVGGAAAMSVVDGIFRATAYPS